MADCDARRAAKILLSLRTRKLTRWPDWIQPPFKELDAPTSVEPEVELPPPLPEGWPTRPRGPLRVRASGWSPSLDGLLARLCQHRSSASSSQQEETPHRVKREFSAQGSASGSGLSTSGGERVSEKAAAPARKEAFVMAASSPETPFDYAAAARSGASSSGDEGERFTAKRKARGTARSGAPSSGDEGCSSTPPKRARADVAAVKDEVLIKIEENSRDEKGHLLFDLNEDISMAW